MTKIGQPLVSAVAVLKRAVELEIEGKLPRNLPPGWKLPVAYIAACHQRAALAELTPYFVADVQAKANALIEQAGGPVARKPDEGTP